MNPVVGGDACAKLFERLFDNVSDVFAMFRSIEDTGNGPKHLASSDFAQLPERRFASLLGILDEMFEVSIGVKRLIPFLLLGARGKIGTGAQEIDTLGVTGGS